jgi:hypothetical protein
MLASRSSAAAECRTGTDTLESTDATMVASWRVQPSCESVNAIWGESHQLLKQTGIGLWWGTHFAKREQYPFEKRCRFVQPFLQRVVQVNVQFATSSLLLDCPVHHVLLDFFEEYALKIDFNLVWFKVGDEDLGTGFGCVGCPLRRCG